MTTSCIYARFSVFVESKEIFQKFHSYRTSGIINDVKRKICLVTSIYKPGMIIFVNSVTAF